MNATTIPAIENLSDLRTCSTRNFDVLDLEPLEEEFRPGAQEMAVNLVVSISFGVVICLVAAMLGWYYGLFLTAAFIAKNYINKAEQAQESLNMAIGNIQHCAGN